MYDLQATALAATPAPRATAGETDDASLLRGLLADDPEAWRAFQRTHSPGLLRIIGRIRSRFPQLLGQDDVAEIHAELCLQLLRDDRSGCATSISSAALRSLPGSACWPAMPPSTGCARADGCRSRWASVWI